MSQDDPTGTNWTDRENDLIVADYFEMLRMELSNEPYVKSHRNQALQDIIRRSKKSIEFKHQNISAVLQQLSLRWIPGYKPKVNFQHSLVDGVQRYLSENSTHLVWSFDHGVPDVGLSDTGRIFFEKPPSVQEVEQANVPVMERIVRKFDPAARDARNRALGKQGEETIFHLERSNLTKAGRMDLAAKVEWVSEEQGDGAGYDILSFDPNGKERLLEVKTTTGHKTMPFYISENERLLAEERPDDFRLVRLYDFSQEPKGFRLTPPLEDSVLIKPINYRASFA